MLHFTNKAFTDPTLVIKTGGSAVASFSTFKYMIEGKLYSKTGTDFAALTGFNVADGYTGILTLSINAAGTIAFGYDANSVAILNTSYSSVTPSLNSAVGTPQESSLIGYIVVKNASGATFTGGTTALDASNITVTYVGSLQLPVL